MAKSNLVLKHSSNLKSDIYDINTLSDEYRRFIFSLADAIKRLSDEETILDAVSQCYCHDMRALGDAIERLSNDDTIKSLGAQASTQADFWCNDVNCFAEEYGANYKANEVNHG